jgi:hypothetical protein
MGIRRGEITTKIVSDGLVFNFDAANRACYPGSDTTATDTIGTNNGTLTNSTFQTNDNGVIDFDGVDEDIRWGAIQSGNPLVNQNNFTNCIWVKRTGNTSHSNVMVIWQQRRSNLGYGYTGTAGTTTNKAYSYVGASALNGDNVLDVDTWHYLVYTIDGSNSAALYVDAVLQDSGTRNAESAVGSHFYIGSSGGNYANMEMARASYYNRALSAEEVLSNYNGLRGRFGV